MLYTYKHITNNFSKIHEYVQHLVLEVWCKPNGNYSINKLHPDFIPIVQGVKNKSLLQKPIKEIYGIFRNIYNNDAAGFKKLKKGFVSNNNIEHLCKGKEIPLIYSNIDGIDKILKSKLQKFFKNLYTEVPKSAAFKRVCGDIKSYYNEFLDLNEAEVCPFCGISDIMTSRLSKRDAFDHYLPKDIYPFNSVNPDNLAPICKTCNSSYKLTEDPLKSKKGKKRKAFYPFARTAVKLSITAQFSCSSIDKLKPKDVKLKITNNRFQDEIATWKEMFGIEERYIDKFCSSEAKWWRIQMMDELNNSSKTKAKRFDEKLKLFESNRLVEKNFLKMTYLQACEKLGAL